LAGLTVEARHGDRERAFGLRLRHYLVNPIAQVEVVAAQCFFGGQKGDSSGAAGCFFLIWQNLASQNIPLIPFVAKTPSRLLLDSALGPEGRQPSKHQKAEGKR